MRRHLGNGNLDDAKTALVAARSFGGDLEEIEALQQDIDKALEDDRQPLSDEDLDEVLSSFNALARAIESGNRQAMDEITVSSRQNALFSQLMKSFEKLDIDIVGCARSQCQQDDQRDLAHQGHGASERCHRDPVGQLS